MKKDSGEHKGREVLTMGVVAKPVKVTFAVKSDKIHEFRTQNGSKIIRDIQTSAKKIKNITVENLTNGKNK